MAAAATTSVPTTPVPTTTSATASAVAPTPMSLMVRAIGKGLFGREYEYTAIISIVGDKLVVTGESDPTNVVTISPRRSIVVTPVGKRGADLRKNVATIMDSGEPKLNIIDCEGTDSDRKHGCKTSVFDFVMWARIYGIRVEGKTYTEIQADKARIGEEALLMSWRAGLPSVPSGILKNPGFISQATRLGIVVPRGGKVHKRKHTIKRKHPHTRRTIKRVRGKHTRRLHRNHHK
jgi:hypothetical protein